MGIEDHVSTEWDCPVCIKSGMNNAEWREHVTLEHPEEDPFSDFFPEYHVCRCGGQGGDIFLKAETEVGPYYMAYENRDYVDRMPAWELIRHDWEWIEREETPFPKLEE